MHAAAFQSSATISGARRLTDRLAEPGRLAWKENLATEEKYECLVMIAVVTAGRLQRP